jgi:hypothetical protein
MFCVEYDTKCTMTVICYPRVTALTPSPESVSLFSVPYTLFSLMTDACDTVCIACVFAAVVCFIVVFCVLWFALVCFECV